MTAVKEPKAKPKRAKKSKGPPTNRERKMLDLVNKAIAMRHRVREAEREVLDCKDELTSAKKTLGSRQTQLGGIIAEIEAIRDGKEYQQELPLEGPTNAEGAAPAIGTRPGTNGKPDKASTEKPLLSLLGLSEAVYTKLIDAELETVPDLEKAICEGKIVPGRIRGLGQSAVDKITDALVKFRTESPVEAPKAEEGPDDAE